jgi:hypothetical protein
MCAESQNFPHAEFSSNRIVHAVCEHGVQDGFPAVVVERLMDLNAFGGDSAGLCSSVLPGPLRAGENGQFS